MTEPRQLLEGRAAILARMEEVLADGATLDLHDMGTADLDGNQRRIQRMLTNGRPMAGAMP